MQMYNEKQLELLQLWKTGQLKRLNILEGSVRSGKTWISLVLWALWVWTMPEGGNFLMCAKTLTSLRRNTLELLQSLVGTSNFTYSIPAKEARLFGRLVYLEGANDARAESKIRGMTLQGAYVDELTQMPEDFFTMLLSRLSDTGAKLFATTNPDSPGHWVKKNYLDRADELDLFSMKFLIDDNIFLDPEYVKQLKREYTGVYRSRFILGEWVQASGLIYDMFDPAVHVVPAIPKNERGELEPRRYDRYVIGCDYGTQNPTAFGLWGRCKNVWYMCKEYYYSGRDQHRQKTDKEFADDLQAFIGNLHVPYIVVDPSAASFIAELKQRGISVVKANNAVLDGIRLVASCLQAGKIKICDNCPEIIKEFGLYSWDERVTGEDKPIKEWDHSSDQCRYVCMDVLSNEGQWLWC